MADNRIDADQEDLTYGLAEILQLEPKRCTQRFSSFTEEEGLAVEESGGIRTIDLVVQDVYEIIPEVVNKPTNEETELWSLDYNRLIPIIIKAIQELDAKIS